MRGSQTQHQRQAPSRGSASHPHAAKSSLQNSKPPQPHQQPAPSPTTSAWTKGAAGIGRGRPVSGTASPALDGRQTPVTGTASPALPVAAVAAASPGEGHVSVKGFKARETREWLKRRKFVERCRSMMKSVWEGYADDGRWLTGYIPLGYAGAVPAGGKRHELSHVPCTVA